MTERRPVAQVIIDSSLPHLDRIFDYAVPVGADDAVTGCRVRVRFAGRLTNGFVVGRRDEAAHSGELKTLERLIGVEPVLTEETIALVNAVAERYAGTFSDVARAAVPPRHARAETMEITPVDWKASEDPSGSERWSAYESGAALLDRIGAPRPGGTRAVWSVAPATSWAADVAALVRAALSQDEGGVIVVVPDAADVDRCLAELADARAAGVVSVLTADQGPERRYREFLRVLRGGARLVVGTRAAVFAPVRSLRLIVVWDDGNDALVDPQAPYWDARDVAALRSRLTDCDLVVGSPARTVSTQQWCQSGWAHSVVATRATIATRGPRVRALSADDAARDGAAAAARLPRHAWEAAREALQRGPVLIQVARRGYLPVLACKSCREVARHDCGGPLQLAAGASVPACTWCGAIVGSWTCPHCDGRQFRAVVVGSERTAEEIGRAFPGVRVLASHGGHMIARVDGEPAIVVATPGAEPLCDPGYAAVLLLDARSQLDRPALESGEDALRRWFAAASLATPGARVVITAENSHRAVQALVRWDPAWFAERELVDRTTAGLPPATRMAALLGEGSDILEVAADVTVPHRLLGPVPVPDRSRADERALITVERGHAVQLGVQLRAIVATRSARARVRPVHVRMDPREI